jgi:hypothetical protein
MTDKMFEPLDDYEKELMEELEKGHFKSIDNFEEEKERYSSMFINHFELVLDINVTPNLSVS